MTTSRADATAFLDHVAESEDLNGVAVEFPDYSEAVVFRLAVNKARERARQDTKKILQPTDPGYNKSRWEHITLRIKPHPTSNPHNERERPYMVVAVSSEHLMKSLKLIDPLTGQTLETSLEEELL